MLSGTGAHGAYHAGALRALQEAGVRIDLVAGHGVGAGSAALAAIDGSARLWEADGLWRSPASRAFYGVRPVLSILTWLAFALALVLLTPLIVLAITLVVYPIGFLLTLLGLGAGSDLIARYSSMLQAAFASDSLPTIVPRLAMIAVAALVVVAFVGTMIAQWRAPAKRRSHGGWWWRVAGAPFDPDPMRRAFTGAIWQLIRGAAPAGRPSANAIGKRYADVLAENVGQPGFRELLLIATDLDARRDIVAALLREPFRQQFLAPRPGQDRRAEILDLAGRGREHVLDVMAAALTPSLLCDPALITFSADSFWRGETHRAVDRPASIARLLEEAANAGATQAVIVTAVAAASSPHRLTPPGLDIRHRFGEMLAATEAAALRDSLEAARLAFDVVHVICPVHNPVGPFDFNGAYDEASDRREELLELMERAYEDAYRQFIEPVVGASGEHLARAATGTDPEGGQTNALPLEPTVPERGQSPAELLFDDVERPR